MARKPSELHCNSCGEEPTGSRAGEPCGRDLSEERGEPPGTTICEGEHEQLLPVEAIDEAQAIVDSWQDRAARASAWSRAELPTFAGHRAELVRAIADGLQASAEAGRPTRRRRSLNWHGHTAT